MIKPTSIEVFRDLYLRGSLVRRPGLRTALIAAAADPWCYDKDRVDTTARNATDTAVLSFSRKASENFQAAGLTLWEHDSGYYVPNIVPIGGKDLSIAEYNAILDDFVERIVRSVAPRFDFGIEITDGRQSLEDWTSPEAVERLRYFSAAANKSTRATHPMDQRRWFDFIIAVHNSRETFSTDRLLRWLHEVEGWDEESAHELASDYETALSLLKHYDKH